MNYTEKIAKRYLEQRYPGLEVIPEPDGNTCPDFLVKDQAFEVTELVSVKDDGSVVEHFVPTLDSANKICQQLGAPNINFTKYLSLDKPIKSKSSRKVLKESLVAISTQDDDQAPIKELESIGVRIMYTTPFRGQTFEVGGGAGFGDGGYVSEKLFKSLQHAIDSKQQKCKEASSKYANLDLIVVNRSQHFLNVSDYAYVAEKLNIADIFTSIHLISISEIGCHCRFDRDDLQGVKWTPISFDDGRTPNFS